MKQRLLKLCTVLSVMLFVAFTAFAQNFDKAVYYKSADGLKGSALKSALSDIIYSHTQRTYANLWTDFETTDAREDGKVWDIYSNSTSYTFGTDQAGNYKAEGDKYNREHSFPKSWFNDGYPMYTDLYHLYPSDGYVNGRRSNYCFGDVAEAEYSSNKDFCKLGTPTQQLVTDGCKESKVFEVNDIYKGDMARGYFYMVTAYEDLLSDWSGCGMLSKDTYPSFTKWAENLLLNWSEKDQVSPKETDRIEAVYSIQKNRNPFIDFPGLEQYIWGTYVDVVFSIENYQNPYADHLNNGIVTPGTTGGNSGTNTPGDNGGTVTPGGGNENPGSDPGVIAPGSGETSFDYYFVKVTEDPVDWTGEYIFVYEKTNTSGCVFNASLKTLDATSNYVDATISDGVIEPTEKVAAAVFKIQRYKNAYSIQSEATELYIGGTKNKNALNAAKTPYENAISVSDGVKASCGTTLYFNIKDEQNRFRYFKSAQEEIAIYKKVVIVATDVKSPDVKVSPVHDNAYYDLCGRKYNSRPSKPGLYIHNGKKLLIK